MLQLQILLQYLHVYKHTINALIANNFQNSRPLELSSLGREVLEGEIIVGCDTVSLSHTSIGDKIKPTMTMQSVKMTIIMIINN